jgi:hypothetical protein
LPYSAVWPKTDGVVKVRRGKTHVVTVSLSATKEEITQKAIEKHRSFDQTFDETVAWVLLYPDFQEIQWIPGTTQPFILSNYKQAIGKDYKLLTKNMIPLDDVMENSAESGNESSKLSSLPDIRKYALNRVPANSSSSLSVVHIDDEGASTSHALSGEIMLINPLKCKTLPLTSKRLALDRVK